MRTNKQQAADHRKKLKRIVNELVTMGSDWEDRDNYLVSLFNDAGFELSKLVESIEVDNE